MNDRELLRFKTDINLSEYAAFSGYAIDQKKTSAQSVFMKNGGHEIVIARGESGQWIYFTVGSKSDDNGTIVDFIQNRTRKNLGQVRRELRPWLGFKRRPKLNPNSFARGVRPSVPEDLKMLNTFADLLDVSDSKSSVIEKYFGSLAIGKDLVLNDRFRDKIKTDRLSNAIFPHYTGKIVSGWEIWNREFKGFSPGGKKSVWFSNRLDTDETLILFINSIEALSYFQLYPEEIKKTWCISTGGYWSRETENMLKIAFKTAVNQKIIISFGMGQKAADFDKYVHNLAKSTVNNATIEKISAFKGSWNDDLKS